MIPKMNIRQFEMFKQIVSTGYEKFEVNSTLQKLTEFFLNVTLYQKKKKSPKKNS